jgi:hypothetical protein
MLVNMLGGGSHLRSIFPTCEAAFLRVIEARPEAQGEREGSMIVF